MTKINIFISLTIINISIYLICNLEILVKEVFKVKNLHSGYGKVDVLKGITFDI